jgi:hypothetical protein
MFRPRFKKEIVVEFLPPARPGKRQRVIILCDGMPSIPRKQALVEYLSTKGYWVFYPRWRGAWESGGQFLERSPHEDILDVVSEQKKETSNPSYPAYIRAAFGNGYRLSAKNWNKLHGGVFYNPAHHVKDLTASKILMFHAKDDPYIPWKIVDAFARHVGIRLKLLSRGGHLRTEHVVKKYWPQIERFFDS